MKWHSLCPSSVVFKVGGRQGALGGPVKLKRRYRRIYLSSIVCWFVEGDLRSEADAVWGLGVFYFIY